MLCSVPYQQFPSLKFSLLKAGPLPGFPIPGPSVCLGLEVSQGPPSRVDLRETHRPNLYLQSKQ